MTRRHVLIGGAVIVACGILAVSVWMDDAPTVARRDLSALVGDVGRGAYVARLSGCIACHTDVKAGGAVLAGGPAIDTEFGAFYSPNITPDPEDGIGDWTLDDFARALTAGESPDGRHYYPSFPYAFYTRLTDQDIVDLWAAVRSVPAVAGGPKKHELRFPLGIREFVGVWKRLYFEGGPIPSDPRRADEWNRGRYLAEGPGHCGACHTPRNFLGGRIAEERYAGAKGPEGEKIPPITVSALIENGWEADDLAYALRTGLKPDGDVFGGSMASVVREGTRYWSDSDLSALSAFILNP